jgi:hypothetical protein
LGDVESCQVASAANGIANPALITVGRLLAIPEAPVHWVVYRSGGEMINEGIGRCILPQPVPAGRRLVIEITSCPVHLKRSTI